ncbi:hypothetical protein D3C85_1491090 [compost metagenome]
MDFDGVAFHLFAPPVDRFFELGATQYVIGVEHQRVKDRKFTCAHCDRVSIESDASRCRIQFNSVV